MYGGAPGWKFDYYSYEAYRRKYQDDIREVPRVTLMSLDQEELNRYVELLKRGKQRLAIPTIRMEMEKYNLRQPEFLDERGSFIVKLYKESKNDYEDMSNDEETNNLIVFCKTPRTRKEICDYLGLNSVTYAIQTYVNPLVEAGVIKLSIPDKPKSPKQLYYSVEREE